MRIGEDGLNLIVTPMGTSWPEAILYLVFAAGTAASLFAFFWGRRLRQGGTVPTAVRNDPAFAEILDGGSCVAGEREVEAPSSKLVMDILALHLENPVNFSSAPWARPGQQLGEVHVERLAENELSFTAERLNISAGFVRAEPGSSLNTVRLRWALQVVGSHKLITVGQAWALLLGLPASVLVPALIYTLVLPSNNLAVRAQFLQVLQVCQFLWEPFMFIGIASMRIRSLGRYLEMLIAASAFESRTGRPAMNAGNLRPPSSI